MNSQASNRLEVSRSVFVEELQRMAKVMGRRKNLGDALLMHDVGRLLIRVAGAEFAIPANGRWLGEWRVSATMLRALAKVPPSEDPVVVQVHGGRLKLAFQYSEAELQQSGIAPLIADAREEMERSIATAAKALAPLGVSPVDVRTLVTTRLGGAD